MISCGHLKLKVGLVIGIDCSSSGFSGPFLTKGKRSFERFSVATLNSSNFRLESIQDLKFHICKGKLAY